MIFFFFSDKYDRFKLVKPYYTSEQVVNENGLFRPWESNQSAECGKKNVENVKKYLQHQNDQLKSFRKLNISRKSSVSPQPLAITITYPIQTENMNSTYTYKLNIDTSAFKGHNDAMTSITQHR